VGSFDGGCDAGDEVHPMLVEAEGVPPPQYPNLEDKPDDADDEA
jgi:hypothetical protein